jgi:hypothetical protein
VPSQAVRRALQFLYLGAIAALLASGLLVRTWGVLIEPLDLWADEAWWASLLESRNLDEFGFRPIGYMWLCRLLLDLGRPEVMLRLPSWLAGISALIFLWKSAELSYRTRSAVLLAILLTATQPHLIVFAKEFKPYSVEVFVFSALTFWALRDLHRGRASGGLLTAALVAIPFSYPIVFLYPAIALAFWGERLAGLRQVTMRQAIYGTLLAVALLILIHLWLYEVLGAGQSRWLWGSKYDVFPIDTGLLGGLLWYAQKTWAMLALPGAVTGDHPLAAATFGLAYLAGIAALVSARRFRELALLCTPLCAIAFANVLGYWPYGAFRANLFLVPGAVLIIGHGFDWLAATRTTRAVAQASLVAVLLAAASIDPESYRTKSETHWAAAPQLTRVLDEIERRRGEDTGRWNDVILADWHSWRPIFFYLRDYPGMQHQLRLVRGPLSDLAVLESQIANEVSSAHRDGRATRLWVVVTRLVPLGAVQSSKFVEEFAVYRHEFESQDPDYHPLLIELRF